MVIKKVHKKFLQKVSRNNVTITVHKKSPRKVVTKSVHNKCPKKVSTESVNKKFLQTACTKSVHKLCLQKVSTKSVHKNCSQKVCADISQHPLKIQYGKFWNEKITWHVFLDDHYVFFCRFFDQICLQKTVFLSKTLKNPIFKCLKIMSKKIEN